VTVAAHSPYGRGNLENIARPDFIAMTRMMQ
jgi:hypothetical protein